MRTVQLYLDAFAVDATLGFMVSASALSLLGLGSGLGTYSSVASTPKPYPRRGARPNSAHFTPYGPCPLP